MTVTFATLDWYYLGAGLLLAVFCIVVAVPLLLGLFYSHEFQRLFETSPPLQADQVERPEDDRPVEFESKGGRRLIGSVYRHRGSRRSGLIVFCHEYTGSRWLFQSYVDYLRNDGFDIFTFDFCNHGESQSIEGYLPLQWVTDHEVADVAAAVDYVIDHKIAAVGEIGVFGVSKGGSAAIVAAARDTRISAVATDGAFPTHSVVSQYVRRWIDVVVAFGSLLRLLPKWVHRGITHMELTKIESRRRCRYPHVETSFQKLAARPLFLIHGKRDNYIRAELIESLFSGDKQPEEFWIVPQAKHNQSIEVAPDEYQSKVRTFFLKHLTDTTV